MPVTIIVKAGYNNQFNFTVNKDKCTNNDLALAITALRMAETALLAELAKNMNFKREEEN